MFPQEAKSIIELLAKGIDPDSGEILPGQSVLNSPKVIRALFVAVEALDGAVKSAKREHSSDESHPVVQSGSAGSSTSETEPLPIKLASRNEYSFFEKLMERDQEIRCFLVQISPIQKVNDLWIFGDGQSWGNLIEHNDSIKANQDAIRRVADILCEWMRDCANMAGDRKLDDLAHRFELKLKANQNDIFKLFSRVSKQRDKELVGILQDFSTAGRQE